MTKILVIPDIHGRKFWKSAVSQYKDDVDKIIFLGDYLDPYPDEGITRKNAINNFQEIINFKIENNDKVVLLTGNHDFPYIDKRNFYTRSRYDSSNAYHIEEMFRSHRTFFKIAYETEINGKKYLFSHAGLTKTWYETNKNIIGDNLTIDVLNSLANSPQGIKTLCQISSYRWGPDQFGSIVWADIHEIANNEEQDIPWDYQIIGHTQLLKDAVITEKWACLDCRKAFIIDDEGKFIECEEKES